MAGRVLRIGFDSDFRFDKGAKGDFWKLYKIDPDEAATVVIVFKSIFEKLKKSFVIFAGLREYSDKCGFFLVFWYELYSDSGFGDELVVVLHGGDWIGTI